MLLTFVVAVSQNKCYQFLLPSHSTCAGGQGFPGVVDLQLLKFHMASTLAWLLLWLLGSQRNTVQKLPKSEASHLESDLENAIYDLLLLYLNPLKDNMWCTCKVIQMTSHGKGIVG